MKLGLLVVAGLSTGCGIGVQAAGHSTTFLNLGDEQSTNFTSMGFTIYDKTGIMLAAMGTAGDSYVKGQEAKQQAESQARARGARPGDTYSYSYEHNVYAPVPGNWTYLSYDWGKGDGDFGEISYSQFDLRTKMGNWKVLGGRGKIGIPLGVLWLTYKGPGMSYEDEIDFTWIGMPAGIDFGYTIRPDLLVNGRFVIDPLMSSLIGALGSDWLFVELGGRADYRPLKWLSFYADAMLRRVPNMGEDHAAREWQLTGGLALLFGGDVVPDR